jgi:hypothetical protein
MTLEVARAGVGTDATLALYKGPIGEFSIASDSKKLVIHDGATAGGILTLTLIVGDTAPSVIPKFTGQMWFDRLSYLSYIASGTESVDDWKPLTNGLGGSNPDGLIGTADIADRAVTSIKLALNAVQSSNVSAEAITTSKLALGAVTEAVIAANAITSTKIADSAVLSNAIDNAAVTAAKLAGGSVTTAKIATGAVDADRLAANSVTAVALSAGSVQADKIAANAVTAAAIAAGSVTAGKIAAGSITAGDGVIASLSAGTITAGTLGSNGIYVGSPTLELDGVSSKIIVRDTQTVPKTRVEMGKLGAGAGDYGINIYDSSGNLIISASGLGTGVVGSTQLAAGAVGTSQIATGAVTDSKITSIGAGKITTGTLQAGVVYAGSLSADQITAGTISASRIAAGSLSADVISATSGTFASANIPNLSASKITTGTLDANRIATGSLSATVINAASGTFDVANIPLLNASKINTGTLGASVVYTGSLSASQITTGSLDAARIAAGSISASAINANSGTFNTANIPTLNANKITTGTLGASVVYSGSIQANQISAGTLAAGVIYSGTINANSITAGTLTGSTLRTAASGQRVEISSSTNNISFYNSAGNLLSRMGGTTDGTLTAFTSGGSSVSAVYASASSSAAAVFASNSSSGTCVTAFNTIGSGHSILALGTGPLTGHVIRGASDYNHPTNGLGGSGLVGVNNAGGRFAIYAERGGYGPFTGQHDAIIHKTEKVDEGDIIVDVRVIAKPTVNDAITEIARSSTAQQKTAVGVFYHRREFGEDPPAALVDWQEEEEDARGNKHRKKKRHAKHDGLEKDYDLAVINSLGEGLINVCGENGDIEAGDFITTSNKPGKGMKQMVNGESDTITRNYTVARARESVSFKNKNDTAQIACIYLCG